MRMMTMGRWTTIACGVLVAGSAASGGVPVTTSSTTTTVVASTTTTTLFGGCDVAATFESVLCRLDALVAYCQGSNDFGRLKQGIVGTATKARKQCLKASTSTGKTVSNQLKKCAKTLDTLRHRLDTHNAKDLIPLAVRDYLRNDVVAPLRSDVNALRP